MGYLLLTTSIPGALRIILPENPAAFSLISFLNPSETAIATIITIILTATESPAMKEFLPPGCFFDPPDHKVFAINRFVFKIFLIFVMSNPLLNLRLNYESPL